MTQTTFEIIKRDELIPKDRPSARLAIINISDIDFDDIGQPPSPALITSIMQRGVQVPITVLDTDGRFLLVAGRRRVRASIINKLTTIPALIQDGDEIDALSLTDHALRRDNPAAELRAIERLAEKGYNEKQIAYATGLTVGTIRARMRISGLQTELREAFDAGEITLSAVEQAVKLSIPEQQELALQFLDTGSLTANDVKERRRAHRSTATAALPFDDLDDEASEPVVITLDDFIRQMDLDPQNIQDLSGAGITCIDLGRYDDAKELFKRILNLRRESA